MRAQDKKRKLFIEEYLLDLNATEAAKRAGYGPKAAHVQGCRLLKDDKVRKAIDAALDRRAKKVQISQEWVLEHLKEEAELKGEGTSHAARVRALELLGKHVGMFADKYEHNVVKEERLAVVVKIVDARNPATPDPACLPPQ